MRCKICVACLLGTQLQSSHICFPGSLQGYLAFQGRCRHTSLQSEGFIINNSIFIFHTFKRNICLWGGRALLTLGPLTQLWDGAAWAPRVCRLSQAHEPGAAHWWLVSMALLRTPIYLWCMTQLRRPQTMLLIYWSQAICSPHWSFPFCPVTFPRKIHVLLVVVQLSKITFTFFIRWRLFSWLSLQLTLSVWIFYGIK